MYKVFDYIFFRTYNFYLNRGSDIPIDRGIQLLSLIQGFIVLDLLMIIDFFLDIVNGRFANKYVLGLPVALSVLVINELRYKRMGRRNRFRPFYERWDNENAVIKKRRGILIVILPVFLLFGVPLLLWGTKRLIS